MSKFCLRSNEMFKLSVEREMEYMSLGEFLLWLSDNEPH